LMFLRLNGKQTKIPSQDAGYVEYNAAVPGAPLSMPNHRHSPVDDIDLAILSLVAADARITNQRLAERVGVAPSTALARLRSLRERGVVRGYHAEVDLAVLGRPLQALIAVRLAVHAREQIDAFTSAVSELPGVLMVFHLTGVTDYLVWVAAADAQ